jgi:hypothetical protein
MAIKENVQGPDSVAIEGTATGERSIGVKAHGDGTGVWATATGGAILGVSTSWHGVTGECQGESGFGVFGTAIGSGVVGVSKKWVGVYGETEGIENGPAGVWGEHKGNGTGVKAVSNGGIGLFAFSVGHEALHAESQSTSTAAAAVYQMNAQSDTAALYVKHVGQRMAAVFEGDVHVTGDIRLANADCAEEFDVAEGQGIEPGVVVVLGDDGTLQLSTHAYDRRVAGVISGAGNFRPGLVLDRNPSGHRRLPVALLGKVYCKVDASQGAI